MTLNPHVNVDTTLSQYTDRFIPDDGYALWRDNEEGNLDENGNPYQYYRQMRVQKSVSEEWAPHIWAKLIDETMEVYGNVNQPAVMALGLDDEGETNAPASHTYVDENGEQQMKKGVY